MAKSAATSAPLSVTVAGHRYELVPTLAAVRTLNGAFGGLAPALTALQHLNFDAVAQIILAGSGRPLRSGDVQELGGAIWQSDDRGAILGAVSDYLVLLLNGGKEPEPLAALTKEAEGNG